MKIIIDIPTEFEIDYKGDKFKDFFFRVRCDIEKGTLCGRYEKEIVEMFLKAFDESVQADDVQKMCDELEEMYSKPCMDEVKVIRRKSIDDFVKRLKADTMVKTFGLRICDIDRIAEEMRG